MSYETKHEVAVLGRKENRISIFDRFIDDPAESENKILSVNGGEIFIKRISKTKLSSDIIDLILEAFMDIKTISSLVITYNVPGIMDITTQVDNKTLHWEAVSYPAKDDVPEHVVLSIRFKMSDDQMRKQIDSLRRAGVNGNVVHLSKGSLTGQDEYFDYGEVDNLCHIKLVIEDANAPWLFREEPVCIVRPIEGAKIEMDDEGIPIMTDENHEKVVGCVISVATEKHPELSSMEFSEVIGMLSIGFISAGSLFSEEQMATSEPMVVEENVTDAMNIRTDIDCTERPINKEDYASTEQYDSAVKDEALRVSRMKVYWRTVFSSKSTIVQEVLHAYANKLISEIDAETFDGDVQINRSGFEEYIKSVNLYDSYLREILEDPTDSPADDTSETTPTRLSTEAFVILQKIADHSKVVSEAMTKLAEEYNCLDKNGAIDNNAERINEFFERTKDHEVMLEGRKLVHEYAIQLMRDTGNFSEEFLADPNIKESSDYKNILALIARMNSTSEN